jgi:hypothetical protein
VANPFRSIAQSITGILSPRNFIARVAEGLEAFADALGAVAEQPLPGESPRQKRRRIRDEGRIRRRRRRATRRPIIPREPEPEPVPHEPEPEPDIESQYYIRGEYEEGDEDYERATFATLAEAIASYDDLNDAGVPTDLLAIVFFPDRRFPYSLIVRPSR